MNRLNVYVNNREKMRNSNLELLRVVTMIVIVAHHYVVNSGLMEVMCQNIGEFWKNAFLLLFGWGGKTGINCFVLITGYFMCKSEIKLSKFLKLLGEVMFYNIAISLFFYSGYEQFSLKEFLKTIFPFTSISTNFTASFLIFYLFIPFFNCLICHMKEREHLKLVGLLLVVYTLLPSFLNRDVGMNYITWFMVLYFIASYIRIYPKKIYTNTRFWGEMSLLSLLCSWLSVIVLYFLAEKLGKSLSISFFFISDSNKILALGTSICVFLFFENMKIRQSKIINGIGASTFGVLLIHANSDIMRRWLWKDVLQNTNMYNSSYLIPHAFFAVIIVFFLCVGIDGGRRILFHRIENHYKAGKK